jgi:hypothetical protein
VFHLLNLIEAFSILRQFPVRVTLAQELLAATAGLLEEVTKALKALAIWQIHSTAQEAFESVTEITRAEEIVAQSGKEVLRVQTGEVLAPVPCGVVVASAHQPLER